MHFSQQMIDGIVAHAREDAPNECCGIIGSEGGRAVELFRAENTEASPYRFTIGYKDQIRINDQIDAAGLELGAVYHSHTRSAAYPSQTDVSYAESLPGVVWVIVSLEDPDAADLGAFLIEDGQIRETPIEID